MPDVQELRDWAAIIERDGCPDEARLVRDAADEIERLREALRARQECGACSPSQAAQIRRTTADPINDAS